MVSEFEERNDRPTKPRVCEVDQMRISIFVGLIVLAGCNGFRPDYYEGTCVNTEGKEITRYVYPAPKWETSLATIPACDDRRKVLVRMKD